MHETSRYPTATVHPAGSSVEHTRWHSVGTVVRREGEDAFVQWHDCSVEDQVPITDLIPRPDVARPENDGLRLMAFHSDRLGRVTIPE